jgi:hypothetical protein
LKASRWRRTLSAISRCVVSLPPATGIMPAGPTWITSSRVVCAVLPSLRASTLPAKVYRMRSRATTSAGSEVEASRKIVSTSTGSTDTFLPTMQDRAKSLRGWQDGVKRRSRKAAKAAINKSTNQCDRVWTPGRLLDRARRRWNRRRAARCTLVATPRFRNGTEASTAVERIEVDAAHTFADAR